MLILGNVVFSAQTVLGSWLVQVLQKGMKLPWPSLAQWIIACIEKKSKKFLDEMSKVCEGCDCLLAVSRGCAVASMSHLSSTLPPLQPM